jgi:hypothetical protein
LEISDVWGQVTLEADLPQTFACQLNIGESPVKGIVSQDDG